MNASICSLATANPDRYVKGPEAYHYVQTHWDLSPQQDELYRKVLLNGPIRGRYVAVEHDRLSQLPDQDELIELFTRHARTLNLRAADQALHQAGLVASDIRAVVHNTCTGYLCPGLGAYLVEDLRLPVSTKVFDLMGMGCGAAIPNIECAALTVNQYDGPVLSVAVEICSATIFDSPDPGCIISNCIFADGAAAAVISSDPADRQSRSAELLDFQTGVFPQYRDSLKFVSDGGKLRNVLSLRVPVIGAKTIREVTLTLLERNGLQTKDIHHWAIHPGGTAVLEKVQMQLGLTNRDTRQSLDIFRQYGNMSSPSVLFVLKKILDDPSVCSDELCCMLSFGAGFSAHAALVRIV